MLAVRARKFYADTDKERIEMSDPAAFLKATYIDGFTFGLNGLLSQGTYRLGGWEYDLKPWLVRYVYKQRGEWQEKYAPSRGALRAVVCGRIDRIIETEPRGSYA